MRTNQQIIENCLENIKTDVINSLQANGRYATGETVSELEVISDDTSGQLLAPLYIDALEFGRNPTSPNAVQGDPTVFEKIEDWIAAKGLDLNPYAVTKNIHKNGYPGKPGVLTQPLEIAEKHIEDAMNEIAENEAEQLANLFDILNTI